MSIRIYKRNGGADIFASALWSLRIRLLALLASTSLVKNPGPVPWMMRMSISSSWWTECEIEWKLCQLAVHELSPSATQPRSWYDDWARPYFCPASQQLEGWYTASHTFCWLDLYSSYHILKSRFEPPALSLYHSWVAIALNHSMW